MNKPISVLITGYEIAPFFKRGGLGDVMGSLPKALNKIGIDCRAVVPYYVEIQKEVQAKRIGEFCICFGNKEEEIGVYETKLPDSDCVVYFLSNKLVFSYIKHGGKDGGVDQFAFFSLAVARFVHYLSEHHKWTADLIHCNDWHTALIPLILKQKIKLKIPTLLTIHNLMYQGVGSLQVLDLLNMRDEEVKILERGKPVTEINILGEGIVHATRVSTVSQTYAREISESEHDHNPISPFLFKRENDGLGKERKIIGILNGIDYDVWSPIKDQFLHHKFDIHNWEVGKRNNKEDLLKKFGLPDRPTFCFVGRLANQKGLDVLIKAIHRVTHLDINIIILGAGNPIIQANILKVTEKFPWVKAEFIYSEDLAHKIYAGSDFIMIPSRYEPCGLIQMIAMSYGTLPIASRTGGLQDSIANGINGLLFEKGRSIKLKKAIEQALNIWNNKNRYKRMVEKAMKTDFSWNKSAKLYKKLYEEMIH